jgi:hypothetical protein
MQAGQIASAIEVGAEADRFPAISFWLMFAHAPRRLASVLIQSASYPRSASNIVPDLRSDSKVVTRRLSCASPVVSARGIVAAAAKRDGAPQSLAGLGFPGGRQIPCSGIRIPCSGSNSALKFPARLRREFCKKTMQYQRISHIPFA